MASVTTRPDEPDLARVALETTALPLRGASEALDYIEHAVTLDIIESEETRRHSVIYPGVYLCRFENNFTIS
jgi:hypothetical protein